MHMQQVIVFALFTQAKISALCSNYCKHSRLAWSVTQPHCVHSAFDQLRSVREMEYELDFVTNRANRDIQVRWITMNNHFYVAFLLGRNPCWTFA